MWLASPCWRRRSSCCAEAYEWVGGRELFRERVYVLGAGDYARSIVETIRSRPDIGMEVVDWEDVQLESSQRKKVWIAALNRLAKANPPVHRIIVAMEARRGELPVQELLMLRFQGITVEEDGTLRERLYGKIQLDGLRPSNFLYSEGFRIRASQQFTRQVVSLCAAAVGLLLFLPFFPFVAAGGEALVQRAVVLSPEAGGDGRAHL